MASMDGEQYCYTDDEGCTEDHYSTEDDEGCTGDSEDDSDSDEGQAEDTDEKPSAREKGYDFETEDDVRKRQDEVTAKISELLSVPPGFAAVFLRHCRWDAERLENEWFSDERRIRDAVGLPVEGDVPTALSDRPLTCPICFDQYSPGEMRSAGCSHYYCHECWRGYIRAAADDGPQCLLLRCPDPHCSVPVVRELVDEVAADEDRARYTMFVVRSYVEEGTSKYVRWCPGPGCTLAVRCLPGFRLYEVSCACRHVFCFRCGEEAHRPASCDTTREWVAKNSSEGESMNWVLANTKHCPRCRRAIEKNDGCNHMTCRVPCRHEFCWLCLGSWEDHAGSYYHCNRWVADKAEFTEEEKRRAQAKAALERYLHYYERWTAHGASRKKAREDLDDLVRGGGLDRFAATMRVPPTQLDFIAEAYEQIVESRRVLRWTYAYVYYLDPERDRAKREFCEYVQGEAEASLERLHHCAEQERRDMCFDVDSGCDTAEMLVGYRERLATLTGVTRKHFDELVKGFEAGMAEVVV